MEQNPTYRPQTANISNQDWRPSLNEVDDVWEYGYEEQRRTNDEQVKETKVSSRPMNDTDSISNFDWPVDIIVPFHGQYERVAKLIESIFQLTRSNYYTLTVVDDASPNDSFIKTIAKNGKRAVKALRTKTQRGFAGALQVGFDRTQLPYVCCVNSDCVVKDINWLRSMGEALLRNRDSGVKMVSPKTNNPVGGCELQFGEKLQLHGAEEDIRRGLVEVLPEEEYLSLYCFMCHRELFKRIGFLKHYPYGYYEDEEFAKRMIHHGYRQGVVVNSWIYHEGEVTIKNLWRRNPQLQNVMKKENRVRALEDIKKLKC